MKSVMDNKGVLELKQRKNVETPVRCSLRTYITKALL